MGGIEWCLRWRGNSLAWLLCLRLSRGGGRDKYDEEEEGEGEGGVEINKFSGSKVTATFKIIRQIHLFHKCLHFQMPLFGAPCCHCP